MVPNRSHAENHDDRNKQVPLKSHRKFQGSRENTDSKKKIVYSWMKFKLQVITAEIKCVIMSKTQFALNSGAKIGCDIIVGKQTITSCVPII
jgi:hypothetical protein